MLAVSEASLPSLLLLGKHIIPLSNGEGMSHRQVARGRGFVSYCFTLGI